VAETDLDGLPFRAAQAAHDVPHDGHGSIADLIGAFDTRVIDGVAEQRGGIADLDERGRSPVVQIDVADDFVKRGQDIRCVAE
jgi:hypothetical protein